jgi:hypothetical protein
MMVGDGRNNYNNPRLDIFSRRWRGALAAPSGSTRTADDVEQRRQRHAQIRTVVWQRGGGGDAGRADERCRSVVGGWMISLQKGDTQSRKERKEEHVKGESLAPLRLCVRFWAVFSVDSWLIQSKWCAV